MAHTRKLSEGVELRIDGYISRARVGSEVPVTVRFADGLTAQTHAEIIEASDLVQRDDSFGSGVLVRVLDRECDVDEHSIEVSRPPREDITRSRQSGMMICMPGPYVRARIDQLALEMRLLYIDESGPWHLSYELDFSYHNLETNDVLGAIRRALELILPLLESRAASARWAIDYLDHQQERQ